MLVRTALPRAIAGTWAGQIETPPPLEVVVRLDVGSDGTATGTIDIPAQGASMLPLEDGMLTLDAGGFRTEMRPSVDDQGEVEHYVAMQGPVAAVPFEFHEEEGEPVIVLGEGVVSYSFVRAE